GADTSTRIVNNSPRPFQECSLALHRSAKNRTAIRKDLRQRRGEKSLKFSPRCGSWASSMPLQPLEKTNPAIYELDGDELKLCMSNEPGTNKRPAELASKEGSKLLLMTFKRAK